MSCVTVLVGQCGTQLGGSFLHQVANEAHSSGDQSFQEEVSERFFRPPCPRREGASDENGVSCFARGRFGSDPTNTADEEYYPLARCVMVDMEPKAIENLVSQTNGGMKGESGVSYRNSKFRLAATQCVTRDEGSANNWAFGYYHQGASRYDIIVENLRRESEIHGTVQSFHVIHSIAGGTGSGVGCLISEAVRDSFPHALLLHSIVWPFSAGEVTTQWYNTVLAMSCLRDEADAICALYNDDISSAIASRYRHDGLLLHPSDVSYPQINAHMARTLSSLHLPSFTGGVGETLKSQPPAKNVAAAHRSRGGLLANIPRHAETTSFRRTTTSDIVEALALNPTRKIFTGVQIPPVSVPAIEKAGSSNLGGSFSLAWSQSVRAALRSTQTQFIPGAPCLWSLRGRSAQSSGVHELQALFASRNQTVENVSFFASSASRIESTTGATYNIDDGARDTGHIDTIDGHNGAFSQKKNTEESINATVFGSSHLIGRRLEMALTRAEEMLQTRAFLHHYERYGVERSDFNDAIVRLWDSVAYYSEAK